MALASRTLNPLHFEDLDPKRFEDLVRQLLYDFRSWRQLEATGRAGGDNGFDARGLEIVAATVTPFDERDTEDPELASVPVSLDRTWLIQCKRESKIHPKKLVRYLEDIAEDERGRLHGVIFAALADFSITSRDLFRGWCREHGIAECYLWGRSELEDMLFQPKNDNLLFAYFGISLAIRRRSAVATLRAGLSAKRKLKRILDKQPFSYFVARDVSDETYPYVREADKKLPPTERRHRWRVARAIGLTHRGLEFECRKFFAYADGEKWDAANVFDDARSPFDDPWGTEIDYLNRRDVLRELWGGVDGANKAWFYVYGAIPLNRVLEVDDIGDDLTPHPHLFVNWEPDSPHPFEIVWLEVNPVAGESFDPDMDKRVEFFPAQYRKLIPK